MFPRTLLAAAAVLCVFSLARAQATPATGPSGRPVPRYESLKYGEVNGRVGPSLEHRILWTYRRRGLPVRVIGESDVWRQVADPAGDISWVHAAGLSARRTVFLAGKASVPLLAAPKPGATPRAILAPGVVAVLEQCADGWRKLRVEGRAGWVPAQAVWGGESCAGAASRTPRA